MGTLRCILQVTEGLPAVGERRRISTLIHTYFTTTLSAALRRTPLQRNGADSGKLPTSHTCFNTLLLPE